MGKAKLVYDNAVMAEKGSVDIDDIDVSDEMKKINLRINIPPYLAHRSDARVM